jgi:hypothetical protein
MSLPSIDQFKNTLSLGVARNNHYIVYGPTVGSDFTWLCKGANLPASSVNVVDIPGPGGMKLRFAGNRTFADWNVTVYNDTQMIMRRRFESWQSQCAQYSRPGGADALGAYAQSDWYVSQLSRSGAPVRTYAFKNLWPSTLAEIGLAFGDDTPEEFGVTLAYSHYEPVGSNLQLDPSLQLTIGVGILSGSLGSAVSSIINISGIVSLPGAVVSAAGTIAT